MSSMAEQMAARMREDGEDLNQNIDPTAPLEAAAGPGTDGQPAPAAQPVPPAEAQNTDIRSGEEPGPVPYSRFKEVNDAYQGLRGYEVLAQYGYDPDSLSRLAQFEASYVQDPAGTVAFLVDNLDVPDEVKTQVREALELEAEEPPAGGGTPQTPTAAAPEEVPPWAKKIIDREEQRDRQEADARENAARQRALDEVLVHWSELDKAAGISVRESVKLSLIASTAAAGNFQTPQQLAEAARAEYLADREQALGSHIVPSRGNGIGPRSVPRSAAVPSPPQNFGGDIKAATAAVRAAMERGEIPPITPGG